MPLIGEIQAANFSLIPLDAPILTAKNIHIIIPILLGIEI